MEDKRVKVRIYGQEYTISGEREEDAIRKVAEYVDEKMREVSRFFATSAQGSLGVLTAVNVADEYFDSLEKIEELKAAKEQIEKDAQRYMQMWDEAKKSFMQYKEEASKAAEERKDSEEKYTKLEEKCKDYESSIFDLQMENIQLKSQLEKYRRADE